MSLYILLSFLDDDGCVDEDDARIIAKLSFYEVSCNNKCFENVLVSTDFFLLNFCLYSFQLQIDFQKNKRAFYVERTF